MTTRGQERTGASVASEQVCLPKTLHQVAPPSCGCCFLLGRRHYCCKFFLWYWNRQEVSLRKDDFILDYMLVMNHLTGFELQGQVGEQGPLVLHNMEI